MYCAGKQKISESFVVDKFSNLVRTHFLQRCLDPIKSESNKVVGLEVSGEEETLYRLPGIVYKASLTWSEVWYRVIIGMIFIDFLFVCKKKSRFVKKEEKITWWWSTSQKVKVWGRGRGTANVNITSKPI